MEPFNRLAGLVEDWAFLLRQQTWRNGLPIIGRETLQLPYRRIHFYLLTRSLEEPMPGLATRIEMDVRPFAASDLDALHEICRPSELRNCAKRLAGGYTGFVAVHAGRVIGYAWGTGRIDPNLERVELSLEPGDVLCTDVFTSPLFRGKGVQTALTLARFNYFKQMGYHRAVCIIEVHNSPSLAVWQRKLDARIVGEIDFLRMGIWYRVRTDWTGRPNAELVNLFGGS